MKTRSLSLSRLVVDAGDNTVTSFAITRDGLSRRDVEASGGIRPVSVTVHDDVVYVLNTGSDSISGFRINDRGNLTPIANSAQALSTTETGAAEVKFTHDGDALIVTEMATNTIDTFDVSDEGVAGAATFTRSVGVVPYGFDIDRRDHVVVSEAATGSVSSYRFDDGALSVTTGALADTQGAPCWLVISTDDRFAYTTNAASGTISSYRIARDGLLTLLAAVAGTTGAGPTDVAVSSDGSLTSLIRSRIHLSSQIADQPRGALDEIAAGRFEVAEANVRELPCLGLVRER